MKLSDLFSNLRKGLPLLISTVGTMGLLLAPEKLNLLAAGGIFALVLVLTALGWLGKAEIKDRFWKICALALTLFVEVAMGYYFYSNWQASGILPQISQMLHISVPLLLSAVTGILCAVEAYFVYILSCWAVVWLLELLDGMNSDASAASPLENLKRNWFFVVSAGVFFALYLKLNFVSILGLCFALLTVVAVAARVPSIWKSTGSGRIILKVLALASALGIALMAQKVSFIIWISGGKNGLLNFGFAAGSLYFLYVPIFLLYRKLEAIFRKNDLKVWELAVYGVLILLSMALMVYAFLRSKAFYEPGFPFDVIFTSDSPELVRNIVYLNLFHDQNDLRQPLFAVFAAPFTAISYLLGRVFGASTPVMAILLNASQILMLFLANLMVCRLLELNPLKRLCFMGLTFCCYHQVLFTLMMEQYIVAYFWLILCIYVMVRENRTDPVLLWGAGGTLLTSMVLVPFIKGKDFRQWLLDVAKLCFGLAVIMVLFYRFTIVFSLFSQIKFLGGYTGPTVSFLEKLWQYTIFVRSCFVAPLTEIRSTLFSDISWQMVQPEGFDIAGIVILGLCVISAIVNRRKKSTLFTAGWMVFSVVLLAGLGWGTAENGLILYGLYFGWTFPVLLFQLVEWIADRLKLQFLVPVVSLVGVVALAAINIPGIKAMLDFAISNYPA